MVASCRAPTPAKGLTGPRLAWTPCLSHCGPPVTAPRAPLRKPGQLTGLPPRWLRIAAFAGVLAAGACGVLIGWVLVDLQCRGDNCLPYQALGALVGGLITAGGGAVVGVLAMRASTEWTAVQELQDTPRLGR